MSGCARGAAMIALLFAGACRHPESAPERDAAAPLTIGPRAAPDPGPAKPAQRTCGPADPCGPGEYCAYTPGLCGKGKRPGTCEPRPESCSTPGEPVCGCDGQVHASACAAHAAGVDLAVMGGCGHTVPGFAACGAHYCDARTSYCEIDLSDVLEPPTDYVCKALPPSCVPDAGVAQECSCFPQGTRCLSFCGHVDGPGLQGFHLTCRR